MEKEKTLWDLSEETDIPKKDNQKSNHRIVDLISNPMVQNLLSNPNKLKNILKLIVLLILIGFGTSLFWIIKSIIIIFNLIF